MNVVTRGIRNAFRNTIRTGSIVLILGLTIGLSLSMLLARQAVGAKIASVKASISNTVNISPAGLRGFEGGGEALTNAQLATISNLAHVTSVDKTLSDRLDTSSTNLQSAVDAGSLGKRFINSNGQDFVAQPNFKGGNTSGPQIERTFTPPVTLIGTTNPTNLSDVQGGGSFTLKSGHSFNGNSSDLQALVGSSLATKNSLSVGSTFTAHGKTISVVGIFDAGNSFANNEVIMPLAAVQSISDQAGSVTSATVHVDTIDNIVSVTNAVKSKLGDKADVTNDSTRADEIIKPLENIRSVTLYSLIGAVGAGAVIILLTMIMIVRERRREIGVLKAIGASNIRVIAQFMTESVTLTSLGAIIGIGVGIVASNPITKMLVDNSASDASTMNGSHMATNGVSAVRIASQGVDKFRDGISNITANVGWDIILYGLGAAIVIGVIGSVIASFFIAKVRPAEVMRAE